MRKEIIKNIIEQAINNHTKKNIILTDELETTDKCTISNRPQFKESIKNSAQEYGLHIDFGKRGEDVKVSLYDSANDTRINFTKDFLDSGLVDYNNENKDGKMNLDDLINTYDSMPSELKKETNLITFEGKSLGDGVYGLSGWIDVDHMETNTVTLSPLLFNDPYAPSYDYILAHEMTHCLDYKPIPSEDKKNLLRIIEGNIENPRKDGALIKKYVEMNDSYGKFDESIGGYKQAQDNNKKIIQDQYKSLQDIGLQLVNSSSDYAIYTNNIGEDLAEASAMIITAHNNGDSSVRYFNDEISYNDWVATHPYQAQYLLKRYYNENHTIEELQNMGNSNVSDVVGVADSQELMNEIGFVNLFSNGIYV